MITGPLYALLGGLVAVVLATCGMLATADGAHAPAHALSARTLSARDTGHLHYMGGEGSVLLEEGSASGSLPGRIRARLNLGATFSGDFTFYTRGGTIKGRGTATPHGSGRYESFGGSMVALGGTGRYAHAHGRAGLYGLFDRRTYAVTIQTTGWLSY